MDDKENVSQVCEDDDDPENRYIEKPSCMGMKVIYKELYKHHSKSTTKLLQMDVLD